MTNRGYRFILGAALAGLIFICLGIGAYITALSYADPNRYQSYSYTNREGSVGPSSVAKLSETQQVRTPCVNPQSSDDSDLCAQWRATLAAERSADWTMWSVGIGVVGSAFLLWQIGLTRQAVEDTSEATEAMLEANKIAKENALSTERIGTAQVRAYISVTCDNPQPEIAGAIPFSVKFSNSGQSPARRLHLHYHIATMNELQAFDMGVKPLGDLAAGDSGNSESSISFNEISEVFVKGRGGGRLIVSATYVDVFDRPQIDQFHFLLRRDVKPLNWKIEPMFGDLSPGRA